MLGRFLAYLSRSFSKLVQAGVGVDRLVIVVGAGVAAPSPGIPDPGIHDPALGATTALLDELTTALLVELVTNCRRNCDWNWNILWYLDGNRNSDFFDFLDDYFVGLMVVVMVVVMHKFSSVIVIFRCWIVRV
ncbi:hypothetical protein Plhal304r1_c067g0155671 [Plasmopara halstedii]